MLKTLIIIPAYNEEGSIERVVSGLTAKFPQYDYLVVNDGSTDRTEKICNENRYHVVNLTVNMGIGGAVQTGYRYAGKNGYDIAVQIDGDGQHDVSYLEGMISLIEEGKADIVIGSRFLGAGGFRSTRLRRTGIVFLSLLGKILTGVRVRDITSGYRVVNAKFIRIFADDYPADYPEPEAMVIAAVHGGRIVEYPVVMRERETGESSITAGKSVYYMFKVTLAMVIRRISFGIRR